MNILLTVLWHALLIGFACAFVFLIIFVLVFILNIRRLDRIEASYWNWVRQVNEATSDEELVGVPELETVLKKRLCEQEDDVATAVNETALKRLDAQRRLEAVRLRNKIDADLRMHNIMNDQSILT